MRKAVAGAMAAAALAWAGGAMAAGTQDQSAKQQPGSQSAGTAQGHETGTKGTDQTSRDMRSDTRADATAQSNHRSAFEGKKNFDVDGKVQHASAGELTISRKDLPPAKLHVGSGTKVTVDGKESSAAQLQPGQDVKASFNLRGGTAEAVEVKAKKAEGGSASGAKQQPKGTQPQ